MNSSLSGHLTFYRHLYCQVNGSEKAQELFSLVCHPISPPEEELERGEAGETEGGSLVRWMSCSGAAVDQLGLKVPKTHTNTASC